MKTTTRTIIEGVSSAILLCCAAIVASFVIGLLVKSIIVAFELGYGLL